jgi:hypothetical protein
MDFFFDFFPEFDPDFSTTKIKSKEKSRKKTRKKSKKNSIVVKPIPKPIVFGGIISVKSPFINAQFPNKLGGGGSPAPYLPLTTPYVHMYCLL